MTCVSCGKDVPSKTAIRHMESCFNKFEAQTSYGSMHPTQIEGYQMVCDFYNPDTRTYCKRLRAICPEHTKDKVVGDTDLCGAPLVKNLFKQTGDICKVLKKDCSAHYCWEKLRRAELDLDRVRQWVKLDELMDQERQVGFRSISLFRLFFCTAASFFKCCHSRRRSICRSERVC